MTYRRRCFVGCHVVGEQEEATYIAAGPIGFADRFAGEISILRHG